MKPTRRTWLALATGTNLMWLLSGARVLAQQGTTTVPNLADQLKNGLKARRPEEFTYIARVAELAEAGTLPRDYVLAAFNWSRGKRSKAPFLYFQRIIDTKAGELGVKIFDE